VGDRLRGAASFDVCDDLGARQSLPGSRL
jgi:hypothetical protein